MGMPELASNGVVKTPKIMKMSSSSTSEIDTYKKELEALQKRIARAEESEKRADAERIAKERDSDLKTITGGKARLRVLEKKIPILKNSEDIDDAINEQWQLVAEIEELELKHGLRSQPTVESDVERPYGLRSNLALIVVFLGLLVSYGVMWVLGQDAGSDPTNMSAQALDKNFWLRVAANFVLTFIALLSGPFFCYLLFPDVYALWHNKIDRVGSISHHLKEAPSWAVLLFVIFCLSLPVWVFVSLMQVVII